MSMGSLAKLPIECGGGGNIADCILNVALLPYLISIVSAAGFLSSAVCPMPMLDRLQDMSPPHQKSVGGSTIMQTQ